VHMSAPPPGIAPFVTHRWPNYALGLIRDGGTIVSGGADGTVRVWDRATGQSIGQLTGHTSWVQAIAVGPSGEVVSAGGDGTARRWDITSGQRVGDPIVSNDGPLWSVAMTPDGRQLITGGANGTSCRWDARTGSQLGEPLHGHTGAVRGLTVTPDSTLVISCGNDGTVRRWDATTGKPAGGPLTGHDGWVYALAVTPDGRQIVSGGDGAVMTWDLGAGSPAGRRLTSHVGSVFALAVTPDGQQVVIGASDGTVSRWDLRTGRPAGEAMTGHTDWVRQVAVTPDGRRIVSTGNDGTIREWSTRTGQQVGQLDGPPVAVNALTFTNDETQLVTASIDGSIRRWDAQTGAALGRLRGGGDGWINAITVSQDGSMLVRAGEDGVISRWTALDGSPEGAIIGHKRGVRAVAFTPDRPWIVSAGADGTVRRWDRATGEQIGQPLAGHRGAVNAVTVTPDGTQIVSAGSDDGVLRRWSTETGAALGQPVTAHQGRGVLTVTVSPDGTQIVSGGVDGTVRRWDAQTGAPIGEPMTGHNGAVVVVRLTPDGRRIVSGGVDHTVRQWDAHTAAPVGQPLSGHTGTVTSLAISRRGGVVFSGAADGTVRRWELATGQQVASETPAAAAQPRGVLAGVVSDLESDEDRLNIALDVERIAATLGALAVHPPLSIALLGDWGTGKSSFMTQLHARLRSLADQSAATTGSAFASNIRQVRFNAWHYSDDHLWVGLVEHMFRELAGPDAKVSVDTTKQVADLKARMASRAAERDRLATDLEKVNRIRTERGWLGVLAAPLHSVRVGRAAVRAVASELFTLRGLSLLLLAGVGIATIWLGVGYGRPILDWAGGVLALGTPVVAVWTKLRTSTEDVRRELLRRKEEVDSAISEAESDLSRLDPAHRLDRLLSEISTASRYESFRGLTGRIHHDLRRLSEDMEAAQRHWRQTGGTGRPPLQRIVLYLDDLDRCTPKRVVDVLQAMNLLLSMRLFLVVVAVDPRWLVRSLELYHDNVFEGGTFGPLDYLDKIFHIPFALRPMGSHAEDFLRGLLPAAEEPERPAGPDPDPGTAQAPPPETARGTAGAVEARDRGERHRAAPAAGPNALQRVADVRAAPAEPAPAEPLSGPRDDLNPEALLVSRPEQDFLARLTPLLPTPRAVKKMANLYRLMRLSVEPHRMEAFLSGDYRAGALLLAAIVGSPREAREFLAHLARATRSELTELLRDSPLGTQLITLITNLRAEGIAVDGDPAAYRAWVPVVARYGFETYDMFTGYATDAPAQPSR
jgi:WD40 repeat protein